LDLHPRRSHSTHLPPWSIVFGFVQYRNTLVLTEFLAIDLLRISDGLGIGTALTACVVYFIFQYGLSLDLSMTFGAIFWQRIRWVCGAYESGGDGREFTNVARNGRG
jgi:hypothetical protein